MKPKRMPLARVLLLWLPLLYLSAWAEEPAARQVTEVPLLTNSDPSQLLITATINGSTPATLLFDTGGVYYMISNTLAAKLKAQPAPEYRDKNYTINGYPDAWLTRLRELDLGQLKLMNYPALVGNDKLFHTNPNIAADQDGVIGAGALRQMMVAVAVYPRAAKLKFFQPGDLAAEARQAAGFGPGAIEVPLEWDESEQQYKCQVTLRQGEKSWTGRLILDTGSSGTVISAEIARQLGRVANNHGQAFGMGGINAVSMAPVARLEAGGLSVASAQVTFPAPDGKLMEVIGMNVLGRYNLLIDFVVDKLYLTPPDDKPPPDNRK